MKISKRRGFTLIEMLVVIAIIAILTGIIVTDLVSSKAKSRDAKRASDLAQIQLAIEQYFDRCDQYPPNDSNGRFITTTELGNIKNGCPNGITLGNYISVIPTDPSTNASYGYVTNGTPQSDYVLYTTFETTNSVMSQSAPAPTTWNPTFSADTSDFNCTNSAEGGSGFGYCVRPN